MLCYIILHVLTIPPLSCYIGKGEPQVIGQEIKMKKDIRTSGHQDEKDIPLRWNSVVRIPPLGSASEGRLLAVHGPLKRLEDSV